MKLTSLLFLAACSARPAPTGSATCERQPPTSQVKTLSNSVYRCTVRSEPGTGWTLRLRSGVRSGEGGEPRTVMMSAAEVAPGMPLQLAVAWKEKKGPSASVPVRFHPSAWFDAKGVDGSPSEGDTLHIYTAPTSEVRIAGRRVQGVDGLFTMGKLTVADLPPGGLHFPPSADFPFEVKSADGDVASGSLHLSLPAGPAKEVSDALAAFPGKPLPFASAVDPPKEPKPALVFSRYVKGDVEGLRAANGLERMGDVQWVAIARVDAKVIENCGRYRQTSPPYTQMEIERTREVDTVTVYEASTGKARGTRRFEGPAPIPCKDKVKTWMLGTELKGDAPDDKVIDAWLGEL